MSAPDAYRPLVAMADDDDMHAEWVEMWLCMHGFDVVRFGTGDALLSWAADAAPGRGAPVHAVLLDVEMPGRDGFATHAELRKLSHFTGTPILFVSGMSPDLLSVRASSASEPAMQKGADLLPRLTEWLRACQVPV
jgi:DNA-binding response OmpR family regulator